MGQRTATARVQQRGRLGCQRCHERATQRLRHAEHDGPLRHRRLRRTGGERAPALQGDAEAVQRDGQLRARQVLPREGQGQRTALLLHHKGGDQSEVQPARHRHGPRRRTGGHGQARARLRGVDSRDQAHHAQLLHLQRPRGHQDEASPHALRPRQLLVHLQPLAPQHYGRDHRL